MAHAGEGQVLGKPWIVKDLLRGGKRNLCMTWWSGVGSWQKDQHMQSPWGMIEQKCSGPRNDIAGVEPRQVGRVGGAGRGCGGGKGSSMGFLCSELGSPQECQRVMEVCSGGGKACIPGRWLAKVKGLWSTAGVGLSSGGQG